MLIRPPSASNKWLSSSKDTSCNNEKNLRLFCLAASSLWKSIRFFTPKIITFSRLSCSDLLVILICFTLSKWAKRKELRWCQSYCNLCKYWPFSPHVSWLSMNEINGWTKNLSAIQSFFNSFICLHAFIFSMG